MHWFLEDFIDYIKNGTDFLKDFIDSHNDLLAFFGTSSISFRLKMFINYLGDVIDFPRTPLISPQTV